MACDVTGECTAMATETICKDPQQRNVQDVTFWTSHRRVPPNIALTPFLPVEDSAPCPYCGADQLSFSLREASAGKLHERTKATHVDI